MWNNNEQQCLRKELSSKNRNVRVGGGGRRVFVQAGALAPRMIRRRLDQAPGVIMNPPHPPLSLTDASLLACRFALADWCVGAGA